MDGIFRRIEQKAGLGVVVRSDFRGNGNDFPWPTPITTRAGRTQEAGRKENAAAARHRQSRLMPNRRQCIAHQ
jgi:hypothetical protein